MKKCKTCNIEKNYEDFPFRKETNNYRPNCRICQNIIHKTQKHYSNPNRKTISKEFYYKNRENILLKRKLNKKPRKLTENEKKNNRNRYKNDSNYKLMKCLRARLWSALKNNTKIGSAITDLGCSIPELKQYLESKFEPGMTWDNWGNKEGCWSIDHIIPLSTVDLQDSTKFKIVNHYTNLQPIWHIENLKKGNKIIE